MDWWDKNNKEAGWTNSDNKLPAGDAEEIDLWWRARVPGLEFHVGASLGEDGD